MDVGVSVTADGAPVLTLGLSVEEARELLGDLGLEDHLTSATANQFRLELRDLVRRADGPRFRPRVLLGKGPGCQGCPYWGGMGHFCACGLHDAAERNR